MNYKLVDEKRKQIEDILADLSYKEQNEVLFGILSSCQFHTAANMVRAGKDVYMHGDILYENTYAGSNKKGCINLKEILDQWMTIVNTDKEYGKAKMTELVKMEDRSGRKDTKGDEKPITMVKVGTGMKDIFVEFEID